MDDVKSYKDNKGKEIKEGSFLRWCRNNNGGDTQPVEFSCRFDQTNIHDYGGDNVNLGVEIFQIRKINGELAAYLLVPSSDPRDIKEEEKCIPLRNFPRREISVFDSPEELIATPFPRVNEVVIYASGNEIKRYFEIYPFDDSIDVSKPTLVATQKSDDYTERTFFYSAGNITLSIKPYEYSGSFLGGLIAFICEAFKDNDIKCEDFLTALSKSS